jgi:hypothetical protein
MSVLPQRGHSGEAFGPQLNFFEHSRHSTAMRMRGAFGVVGALMMVVAMALL